MFTFVFVLFQVIKVPPPSEAPPPLVRVAHVRLGFRSQPFTDFGRLPTMWCVYVSTVPAAVIAAVNAGVFSDIGIKQQSLTASQFMNSLKIKKLSKVLTL